MQVGLAFATLWMGWVLSLSICGLASDSRLREVFPVASVQSVSTENTWPQTQAAVFRALADLQELREPVSPERDDSASFEVEALTKALRESLLDISDLRVSLDGASPRGSGSLSALLQKVEMSHRDLVAEVVHLSVLNGAARTSVEAAVLDLTDQYESLRVRPRVNQAARVLYTALFALFGTLFYIYNALDRKRSSGERYVSAKFWSGLWFRCGQSLLYTLLLLLVVRSDFRTEAPGLTESVLPLLALLLGMYIETAESFFEALGKRLMRVVDSTDEAREAERRGATDPAWVALLASDNGGVIQVEQMPVTIMAASFDAELGVLDVALSVPDDGAPIRARDLIDALRRRSSELGASAIESVRISNERALVEEGRLLSPKSPEDPDPQA